MNSDRTLLTVGPAARILNCSTEYVRQLERTGKLETVRTENGIRLFKKSDVERLAIERAAKNGSRTK